MSNKPKKIGVIGLGYVGLTLSLALASKGCKVFGTEKNEKIREDLRKGRPHFFEKKLKLLLKRELKKQSFSVVDELSNNYDVYILCVGTPYSKKKGSPDLSAFKRATIEIKKHLPKGALVINRSTVPIGTSRNMSIPILESTGMKCGKDFYLAFAPERTLEGKALEELFSNSQIIGGYDEKSVDLATTLFRKITPTIVNVSSLEAAETIKLLDNTYRDLRFAYSNMIAQMCEQMGLDANEIIKAANIHYPRNNIPLPSPGVGGTCLTKDGRILMSTSPIKLKLIEEARKLNEQIPKNMVERIYAQLNKLNKSNPRFFLVGFAFKGYPETDDLRDSTSLWFYEELKKRTDNIVGYDPVVNLQKLEELGIKTVNSYEEGCKNADCVVFLNNHKSYAELEIEQYLKQSNKPVILFDSWRMFPYEQIKNNQDIIYMSVGL